MLNLRRAFVVVVTATVALGGSRAAALHDGVAVAAQPAANDQSQGGSDTGRGYNSQARGPGRDVRPWWKDPDMAGEVGLTPRQIAKFDRIYEQRQRQIKVKADEYNRLKGELDRMIRERTATPEEVEMQARRLMYPRLDIDVSRTKMLYEMRLVMSAEQNTKMDAMFHRFDHERRAAIERAEQERARARGRGGNPQRP